MNSFPLRLLVCLLLLLGLAACTSSGEPASPSPSPSSTLTATPQPAATHTPSASPTRRPDTPTPTLAATFTPTLPTSTPIPSSTSTQVPLPTDFGVLHYPANELVLALAWSPDGSLLAVAAGENVHLVEAGTLKELMILPVGAWAGSLAFNPDGALLALAVKDGSVQVWDPASGKLKCRLEAHHPGAKSVAFSPDGRWLASTGNDAYVRLWDMSMLPAEGECDLSASAEMIGGVLSVPYAAFSPDGTVIASVDGHRILLREVASQRLVRTIQAGATIFSLAYSRDGSQLASAELGNTIHIWDVASGARLQEMNWPGAVNRTASPNDFISSLAINPQGNLLAAGSSDARVTLWGFADGQLLQPLWGHTRAVTCVAFNPKGNRLAAGGLDASVWIWPLDLP